MKVKLWRYGSCQNTDIIHETLDQFFILVFGISCHSHLALAADFGGGDFDFEFVFEFAFDWGLEGGKGC